MKTNTIYRDIWIHHSKNVLALMSFASKLTRFSKHMDITSKKRVSFNELPHQKLTRFFRMDSHTSKKVLAFDEVSHQ